MNISCFIIPSLLTAILLPTPHETQDNSSYIQRKFCLLENDSAKKSLTTADSLIKECTSILEKKNLLSSDEIDRLSLLRGEAYYLKELYNKALADFQVIDRKSKYYCDALMFVCRVSNKMGFKEKAFLEANEVLKIRPNHLPALSMLALYYFDKGGEVEKGKEYINKTLRLDPAYANGNYMKSVVCMEENQLKQALTYINRAINNFDMGPDICELDHLYGIRALIFEKSHEYDKAVSNLIVSIRLNPKKAAYLYQLWVNYDKSGKDLTSLQVAFESVKLFPRNPDSWIIYSRSLINCRNYELAKSATQQALTLNQRSLEAHWLRGTALYRTSEFEEAIKHFDLAYEINGTNLNVLESICTFYLTYENPLKDVRQALRFSKMALKISGAGRYSAVYLHAMALSHQEKFEEAIAVLKAYKMGSDSLPRVEAESIERMINRLQRQTPIWIVLQTEKRERD